ncbi:hypothetical protein HMPREF2993_01335 [Corynebacterium sp. HMSC068G04]|nr:hypothetical protein HMPREF2993_01335 [Corynebacterium sp. HMSC068G04]
MDIGRNISELDNQATPVINIKCVTQTFWNTDFFLISTVRILDKCSQSCILPQSSEIKDRKVQIPVPSIWLKNLAYTATINITALCTNIPEDVNPPILCWIKGCDQIRH